MLHPAFFYGTLCFGFFLAALYPYFLLNSLTEFSETKKFYYLNQSTGKIDVKYDTFNFRNDTSILNSSFSFICLFVGQSSCMTLFHTLLIYIGYIWLSIFGFTVLFTDPNYLPRF